MKRQSILLLLLSLLILSCQESAVDHQPAFQSDDWATYLGGPQSAQFKAFSQINPGNVNQLQVAWTYAGAAADSQGRSQIQCNPLIIGGVLYGTTASLKLVALNAKTGEQQWVFNPFESEPTQTGMGINRGIAFWQKGTEARILYACRSRLFAINAKDGSLINSFGTAGVVDLKKGLGRNVDKFQVSSTTPGVVYDDLFIIGSSVSEGADHAPGHIRAYDILTGEIEWIFHTIPYPDEYGSDTWPDSAYLKSGGANAWAGMSLDPERGMLFAPTGSASFDFYGGDRIGENLFANCILALDARTGKRIWHYQTVHHDIWDRDLPAPPNLVTVEKDGKQIDAIAQVSKSGYLFVLNRETGEPIYPIEEKPFPPSGLEGEQAWPTQPIPTTYPVLTRTILTEADLAIRSPQLQAEAQQAWDLRVHGEYLPPTEQGNILFPGLEGGAEWGGSAYDPTHSILFVNTNQTPWEIKTPKYIPQNMGQNIYQTTCSSCHGKNREGGEKFGKIPALTGIKTRMTEQEAREVIRYGKGIMPAFRRSPLEIRAVIDFLFEKVPEETENTSVWPYPYYFEGYTKMVLSDGLPITRPPWGELLAVDLNKAEIKWRTPLGDIDSLDIPGYDKTGTENFGGPLVTAGGLLFIAGTADEKIRAFHMETGEELWSADLPAGGFATPATYMLDGKQYVVIACGGGKVGMKSGDQYVAFCLPD